MPPRTTRNTRAKAAAAATDGPTTTTTSTAKYILDAETDNPPRLFVLPKKVTAAARIVTLPHPRSTAKPSRFLVCPETGVYEFTKITTPKAEPRSWLLGVDKASEPALPSQTIKDADLFVATAVDPLFLILPALFAEPASSDDDDDDDDDEDVEYRKKQQRRPSSNRKRMFLTADDHFDALPQTGGSHLAQLLRTQPAVQRLFTQRMAVVCDTVAAGDETMYRLNEDKLLLTLLAKAQRTGSSHTPLPPTLEAKFVTKALEAPIQCMRSAAAPSASASASASASSSTPTGSSTPLSVTDSVDSEATASTASSVSTAPTTTTTATTTDEREPQVALQTPDEVVALQRLRVAFQFICSRYVPPAITQALQQKLKDSPQAGGVDFAPLDAYLAQLESLRKAAVLARSAASMYAGNNKRGLDAEEADDRAEKKRRQQEEDKRKKASESRGVRNLKKVNVTGMKKMSDFFKKV